MKLLPDEESLSFEGFTRPVAVYRINRGRVVGAWVTLTFLVVMALAFLAGGVFFLFDPEQIRKPLLLAIFWGFSALWLGLALWMFLRLRRVRGLRVLVYPEGFAAWTRGGKPRAYHWDQVCAIDRKWKTITQGPLETWAYVGKDLEYRLTMDDGRQMVINAMLVNIEELGSTLERECKTQQGSSK